MRLHLAVRLGSLSARFSSQVADLIPLLDSSEQRRYFQYGSEKSRHLFLLGRLLLRHNLSSVAGTDIAPRQWKFTRNRYGKPVLEPGHGFPDLAFNVSYTDRVVAIAVSRNAGVGIDIELFNGADLDISASLAPAENRRLAEDPPAVRQRKILRIWTVKEAYAKLLGLGVSLDFRTLDVDLGQAVVLDSSGQNNAASARIISVSLKLKNKEYLLSLAVQPECI